MDMGLDNFHDLVASNALVRPGAANTIGKTYIARKQGRDFAPKVDPVYDSITSDTYGVVLYQEQVMLLCRDLAGLSWGDANKIRRIIGKKKDPHEFEQFRQKFVTGATTKVGESMANQLWSDFEAHAAYSFNASHAVAYSTVSYWTAWLKLHYPLEFMFALLRNESSKQSRANYLLEAKRLGIKVLLPHVNDAEVEVSISGERLMFGLADVKYISEIGAKKIKPNPNNTIIAITSSRE
jgi:DNA polymerase-3 subunit alpha